MPRRDDAFQQIIDIAFHARILHNLNVRRQHKHSLILNGPRIGLRIVENPIKQDVAKVGPPERHREFGLITKRMAIGIQLSPTIHVDQIGRAHV